MFKKREEYSGNEIKGYENFAKNIVNKHTFVDDEDFINVCDRSNKCFRTSLHVSKDFLIDRLNYDWRKIHGISQNLFNKIVENTLVDDFGFSWDDATSFYMTFISYETYKKYYSPLEPEYINESTNNKKTYHLTKDEIEFFYDAYREMGVDDEWAKYDLTEIISWLNNLPETITLYRLLYVGDDNTINREELGDHYTQEKKELLYNHYNKGSIYGGHWGHPVLVTVEATKPQIDVYNTIHNNILYPHEKEITLKDKGRGVTILKVERL